jgi:hypothetical protein
MPSKNKFEINGDTITISRDEWDALAFATYREDYYEELSTHAWSLKKGYPDNATLGGGLHRYMMAKWYGEDVLKDFTDRGYVVDHMNNNHMDCRITNLEFLKKAYNTAKGQAFDVDAREMQYRIAVNIFKDFTTGYYQITIGCNDPIGWKGPDGKIKWVKKTAWNATLKKKGFSHLTARVNFSLQSCPALRRKRAGVFPRTSPGVSARASPTARCIYHTSVSSAMKRAKTADRLLLRKKLQLFA